MRWIMDMVERYRGMVDVVIGAVLALAICGGLYLLLR